jgi:branched-chain amino acid transport system substrate-binding protein
MKLKVHSDVGEYTRSCSPQAGAISTALKWPVGCIALLIAAASGTALAQTQGVSKTEIVIGSGQDLSGPLAGYSKPLRNGMMMRTEEINEQGGINGRKLKLIVEDHGYDPKKAVLATQKMVQRDKIFAMVGTIGTAMNLASMPIQFEKNVPNLFPLTASREMYEPLHKLKFSFAATYYDQIRSGVKYMVKAKGYKKVCSMYQDDDFGLEVVRGAEAGLKEINLAMVEKTTYKRGATDFSSQIARMHGAGCDLVVLGTIIRETVGAIGEARKIGWNVDFIGTSAAYDAVIHKLGGKLVDGFYAMNTVNNPYMDDASKNVREWAERYKKKFNEDPTVYSAYGYLTITLFATLVENTGPNLSTESFLARLEKTTYPRDFFGADEMTFSKTKHLGTYRARLSQIQNGRWTPITDYITE